jgi:hypothetical protein
MSCFVEPQHEVCCIAGLIKAKGPKKKRAVNVLWGATRKRKPPTKEKAPTKGRKQPKEAINQNQRKQPRPSALGN